MVHFLSDTRLLKGPWQAFERDVARALISAGFHDVRVVGGPHDKGADILGVKDQKVWVVQCKFTSSSTPPKEAVQQVVEAGQYYAADKMLVATSRSPGQGMMGEVERYKRIGLDIGVLGPRQLQDLVNRVPEYPISRRVLRPYQQLAYESFREALIDVGRGLVVLATGLGKTIVMAEVIADLFRDGLIPHERALVLADKKELVRQLQFGFWHQLPKSVQTHLLSGDEMPSYWDGITFATVQSVVNRVSELPEFGLVLIDEAHHIGSPTFVSTLQALSPEMIGGVTATPWRGDGFEIESLLGQPLVQFGIAEGLKNKFLCEVDYRLLADNLNWEIVQKKSSHNYSISQLNRKLIIPVRDEEATRQIVDIFKREDRRAGLVFCPTVEHAQFFAATLRTFGVRAESISAELTSRERDRLMSSYRKGLIDILTSVDLFNEGVDVPDVDLIVFMRATHSRRIFVQQLGRGLRTSTDKDKVIVMDFVTDLRRMAEVIELERAAAGSEVERLPLGNHVVQFGDRSAGDFMFEWMKDQADLLLREGDPKLELPRFDFPEVPDPGNVE